MIEDGQLFHKSVTVNTFDNNTILSPFVSNRRVSIKVARFISQPSSNLNACTLANIVSRQLIILMIAISIVDIILQVSNQNGIQNRILESINRIITSTLACAVQLGNDNFEVSSLTSRFGNSISNS